MRERERNRERHREREQKGEKEKYKEFSRLNSGLAYRKLWHNPQDQIVP